MGLRRSDAKAIARLAWAALGMLLLALILQLHLLVQIQKLIAWHVHVSAVTGVATIDEETDDAEAPEPDREKAHEQPARP